jgi:hypothetical protein
VTYPVEEEEWPDFLEFKTRVAYLAFDWKAYCSLFKERGSVDLMNSSAPSFFNLLQRVLRDDIVRRVAISFDSPEVARRHNLVVDRVVHQSQCWLSVAQMHSLKNLRDKASDAVLAVRKYRNRILAHQDLNTAKGVDRYPRLTGHDVTNAIECLFRVLNFVEVNVFGSETAYEYVMQDADSSAIRMMEDALWHRHIQLLLRNGVLPDDIVAKLVKSGRHLLDWRAYCFSRGLPSDYWRPGESGPYASI